MCWQILQALFKLTLSTAIGIAIFSTVLYYTQSTSTMNNESVTLSSKPRSEKAHEHFKEYLKSTKERYPSQTFETRMTLYSAISNTMTLHEPSQPSSVILLAPPELEPQLQLSQNAPQFTQCWVKEIGLQVHSAIDNMSGKTIFEIDPKYFERFESITDVHTDLFKYLKNDDGKVVIVHGVEDIDREDRLMALFTYAANKYAPVKRATFLFILQVPLIIHKKYNGDGTKWNDQNAAEIAEEILESSWSFLTEDMRRALITRLVDNVVMIRPGDKCHEN